MQATQEQQRIIRHRGSHALISATAGSGKTEAMTRFVAGLVADGVPSRSILVLMFNKQAQVEFTERLQAQVKDGQPPRAMTFHGFASQLCGQLEQLGVLPAARLVTDEHELLRLLKNVVEDINGNLPPEIKSAISTRREILQDMLSVMDARKGDYPYLAEYRDHRTRILFERWESMRQNKRFRSFADLVYDALHGLERCPDQVQALQQRYRWIVIDEFQDINEAQMHLVRTIVGHQTKVVAVGDEDQCIYQWRGARPEYMTERFAALFPDVQRYSLQTTFRYGPLVAVAANKLLAHNTARTTKQCVSAARATKVRLVPVGASNGAQLVQELHAAAHEGIGPADTAILVREFAHSLTTELALLAHGIPYRVMGAQPFFEREESLLIESWLLVASNTLATVTDDKRRYRLAKAALRYPVTYMYGQDLERIASSMAQSPELARNILLESLQALAKQVASNPKRTFFAERLAVASDAWITLAQRLAWPADKWLGFALQVLGVDQDMSHNPWRQDKAKSRWLGIHKVVAWASSAGTIAAAAQQFRTIGSQYARHPEDQSVVITSIHRAKGLEWRHVLMPWLSDEDFPGNNPAEIEAERRLFYVGMTRCRDRLTLCFPDDTKLFQHWQQPGKDIPPNIKASRFLYECAWYQAQVEAGQIREPGTPSPQSKRDGERETQKDALLENP